MNTPNLIQTSIVAVIASLAWWVISGALFAGGHTQDSLDTVKQQLAEGKAVLLDVREMNEWKAGHLKQAQHVPLSNISKGIKDEELLKIAPKGTVVYTHCRSGVRSMKAADLLRKSGRDVRALKQGYQELLKAGFPLAKP